MKNLFTSILLLLCLASFAQVPQGFNYQAVVRDSGGSVLTTHAVSFKFSVIPTAPTEIPVYVETHSLTTDNLGSVNMVIGQGTATTATFSSVDWSTGTYFLSIEINTGSGYVALGSTQFLSVPYAMYAKNSGSGGIVTVKTGPADIVGPNNVRLQGVVLPTEDETTQIGFAYSSTVSTPTIDNSETVLAGDIDEVDVAVNTYNIVNWTAGMTYWYRIFKVTATGVTYGKVLTFIAQ